jgi:uncharacterized protein (TIGR03435 family)
MAAGAAFGQQFEAADVHPSPQTNSVNVYMTGGVVRNGRYDLRKGTMIDLITTAWGVDADTVVGGPSWLELNRYDIAAKVPQGTPHETVLLMLQNLLEERFGLVVNKDVRPVPAYVLTVGKGNYKLKAAEGSANPGCRGVPQNPAPGAVRYNVVECHKVTMEYFVKQMRDIAGDYLTSPVFDNTQLQGEWDFEIKWTNRAQLPAAGSDGISFFDAVEKQLGLKLDFQKAPGPVLVVESVNEKPSENPAGTAQALPPPPELEFDVSEIKLSPADARQSVRLLPGGRIEVTALTLKALISLAWDFNSDEFVTGGPKWWDSTRYSVTAKSASATGPANAMQADLDDLRPMLQHLLADRLQLKTHFEDRPVTAYTLLAGKPKLTKAADPASRAGCREASALAKDPRNTTPALSRLLTCTNVTMEQFAALLQPSATGYLQTPVKNETGIEGTYDIQLSFSTAGYLRNAGRPAAGQQPGGDSGASDPSGGVSLFDAVSRQLGLKLEMQKRPMPVLVIDHAEEKPTDN